MRTLNREITRQFFVDQEQGYQELEARWKQLLDQGEKLTASAHLLYAALRGKDWRKGFTPVTNQKKLENGRTAHDSVRQAQWGLGSVYRLFEGVIVPDVFKGHNLTEYWRIDD